MRKVRATSDQMNLSVGAKGQFVGTAEPGGNMIIVHCISGFRTGIRGVIMASSSIGVIVQQLIQSGGRCNNGAEA